MMLDLIQVRWLLERDRKSLARALQSVVAMLDKSLENSLLVNSHSISLYEGQTPAENYALRGMAPQWLAGDDARLPLNPGLLRSDLSRSRPGATEIVKGSSENTSEPGDSGQGVQRPPTGKYRRFSA